MSREQSVLKDLSLEYGVIALTNLMGPCMKNFVFILEVIGCKFDPFIMVPLLRVSSSLASRNSLGLL